MTKVFLLLKIIIKRKMKKMTGQRQQSAMSVVKRVILDHSAQNLRRIREKG